MARQAYFETLAASFETGAHLGQLEAQLQRATLDLNQAPGGGAELSLATYRQLLRALQGATRSPTRLDDDQFDEAVYLTRLGNDHRALAHYHTYKLVLANHAGDLTLAMRHARQGARSIQHPDSSPVQPIFYFHAILAWCSGLEQVPDLDRDQSLAQIDADWAYLEPWRRDRGKGFEIPNRLVAAARAAALTDNTTALRLYDQVLEAARSERMAQFEALAASRAARLCRRLGMSFLAHTLEGAARRAYGRWGAPGLAAAVGAAGGYLDGRFLGDLSHDLRSPLNAVLGFAAQLRDDPVTPAAQRGTLDNIHQSGGRLLALIDDALELALLETGQGTLRNGVFDLAAAAKDLVDRLSPRANEKGVALRFDYAAACPRYLIGDQDKIMRVLNILLDAAIDWTGQGRVGVQVGARRGVADRLILDITAGTELPPDAQAKLFVPFAQLGATRGRGNGLALVLAKGLVELMGGRLELLSHGGSSQGFHLELPLVAAGAAPAAPAPAPRGAVVELEPGQGEVSVLLVEDELSNRVLLRRLLERAGLTVRVAENGADGVSLFREWRPQLILMDRRMPVMEGPEAIRQIRALSGGEQVKIIGITASSFLDQNRELLDAGADTLVNKPFQLDDILNVMADLLGLRFVREAPPAPPEAGRASPLGRLGGRELRLLPDPVRTALTAAVQELDLPATQRALEPIRATQPELVARVLAAAREFQHEMLLHWLDGKN